MRDEMLTIVQEMVDNGYCLFDETLAQFVDRMIGYGFDVKSMKECRDKFMNQVKHRV